MSFRAGRPLKIKEMASEMKIPAREYREFRDTVKRLLDEGKLVRLRRGRIGVPSEMNLVIGRISISRSGVGQVYSDDSKSVEIPPQYLDTALEGDRVLVRIDSSSDVKAVGRVIKIIERANQSYVGTFQKGRHFSWVVPDMKRLHRNIYIPNRLSLRAVDGEKVTVKITLWEQPHLNPEGEVIERLGTPGDPKTAMLTVMRSYNLPEEFPPEVVKEAEKISNLAGPSEMQSRRDFTDWTVYTIDPVDAKDYDDAVTVTRTAKGYRLGVFIADVSHYVRSDTTLDREAFNRGNSVYLPGSVIPMLPENLSNDICSLKPNVRRLVYSTIIDFDGQGKMLGWEIVDGVIKSRARLTYEEVQAYFDSGAATPRIKKVAENLDLARELAKILTQKRMESGSLDFDLPEARIVMDSDGKVIEIGKRVRSEANRLVEEFMLAANKAVALDVSRKGFKFLYRVHDRPDMEKLEAFSYLVGRLGYKFPVSKEIKPIQFARFLEQVRGRPEEEMLNELMLRSMKKAVYQPKNIGHFGLAFKHYTHFTSPIRRYPDLMVHRLLKILGDGRYPVELENRLDTILNNVGRHCSETERLAEAAEREAIKIKQVEYMSAHVGEEYTGVVSGVLSFGFFVRLDDVGAEGMIRLSTLDDDYYHFEEKNYRLVGRRTGRVFQLGDPVKVGVLKVDIIKNEIDLFLVEASPGVPGKKTGRSHRSADKDRKTEYGRPAKRGKSRRRRR